MLYNCIFPFGTPHNNLVKSKTTKQILKTLDSCLGVTKRTKGIIKMYADYIKLYKQKKIKIGNFNTILIVSTL